MQEILIKDYFLLYKTKVLSKKKKKKKSDNQGIHRRYWVFVCGMPRRNNQ